MDGKKENTLARIEGQAETYGARLTEENAKARTLRDENVPESTERAYKRDLAHIGQWCEERGLEPVPASPDMVSRFIGEQGDIYAAATVARRVATWSKAHSMAEIDPNPCQSEKVRATLSGLRKRQGKQTQAQAFTSAELAAVFATTKPVTIQNVRDRAVLAVGLATALRRSELVALNVEDFQWSERGAVVTIRKSKTDQAGEGDTVWLPRTGSALCPVRALEAWLMVAGIESGAVFRSVNRHGTISAGSLSDRSVADIVKRAAERAELPDGRWAGHSLRAGFVTDHARRGAHSRTIARQTRHSPASPVLYRYVRLASVEHDNAAASDGWL